ncbi:DUF7115 domain-containing protein [Halorubrum cibi]|uniref:DUF7115 domain-containing protein n=1 Tax=Halorubrum cibi TaxID=413815 RepID=A0A521CPL2_9EURY|nr:hypothetical protein [Halorubrum cibi]SMO61409.1 hypothetical protein SAMN06264867_10521 [Halorubrum cibi]
MSLPELLSGAAGDEEVVARVPLGGDDLLAVTPTRTLVYRADGLLSDETVEEYPHDAERIAVSTGRRKSKVVFGYGLDGEETLTVPSKRLDDVVHPVLAGVLSARGVTDPGESVARTFRFSELTLVVTDSRLVKHVGSAVWDEEFEEFPYADLTDLDFEEGTVATAVVLTHGGRSERFKAPNESARAVRESLVDAVCAFHDVGSLEELRVTVADDAEDAGEETTGTTDFGEGPDPLSASPAADAEAAAETGEGFETRSDADPEERSEAIAETDVGGSIGTDFDRGGTESVESHGRTGGAVGNAAGGNANTAGGNANAAGGDDPLGDDFGTSAADANGSTGNADATADPANADRSPDTTESIDGDGFEGSPFESAGVEDDDLATEVTALRQTVEAQSAKIERQSELIERLIEELRQGR